MVIEKGQKMNEHEKARLALKLLLMSSEDIMRLAEKYADRAGLDRVKDLRCC